MVRSKVFFQTMVVSVILPRATASRPTTNPMTTVVMHFTIVWGFSLQGSKVAKSKTCLSFGKPHHSSQASV